MRTLVSFSTLGGIADLFPRVELDLAQRVKLFGRQSADELLGRSSFISQAPMCWRERLEPPLQRRGVSQSELIDRIVREIKCLRFLWLNNIPYPVATRCHDRVSLDLTETFDNA